MSKSFELGDTVWTIKDEGFSDRPDLQAKGPAKIKAKARRCLGPETVTTYEITGDSFRPFEREIDRSAEDLFPTEAEAQAEADRRHNAWLDSQRR